ncbi:MAG: sulfotransferase [Phycisphaerae bacterium]
MTRLAYITSPSYSGSTLLTVLLGAHADVGTVGEMKAQAMGDIETYRCSCGELITECSFWKRVREGMERRGLEFDVAQFGLSFRMPDNRVVDRVLCAGVRGPLFEMGRHLLINGWPGCKMRVASTLRRNEVFVEVLAEIFGCSVVVDGSKDPIRLAYLRESDRFDISVIHVTRDGRGVANSFRRHERFSIGRGGAEFVRGHREAERVLALLPKDRTMRLIYEELCADPSKRMKEVYSFLGVDPAEGPADLGACEQHIIGNSMRLQKLSEIRCDVRWQDELSEQDLQDFENVAGELNRALGYA